MSHGAALVTGYTTVPGAGEVTPEIVPFCLICISLGETCTCHKAFYKYFCGFGIRKTTKILWLDLQSLKIVSDFQKK